LWVEVLTSKGPLRPALDTGTGTAADVMWLLMSPGNYYRLVHRRRWTNSSTNSGWPPQSLSCCLLSIPEGTVKRALLVAWRSVGVSDGPAARG
jgi:hypothetical protein